MLRAGTEQLRTFAAHIRGVTIAVIRMNIQKIIFCGLGASAVHCAPFFNKINTCLFISKC